MALDVVAAPEETTVPEVPVAPILFAMTIFWPFKPAENAMWENINCKSIVKTISPNDNYLFDMFLVSLMIN